MQLSWNVRTTCRCSIGLLISIDSIRQAIYWTSPMEVSRLVLSFVRAREWPIHSRVLEDDCREADDDARILAIICRRPGKPSKPSESHQLLSPIFTPLRALRLIVLLRPRAKPPKPPRHRPIHPIGADPRRIPHTQKVSFAVH